MNRLELMHDLALSIYKLFFLVTRKVRFLAMTMSEQARHCSFGLTKTVLFHSLKSAFSRHGDVRANSALFIWLNENVGKHAKSNRETSR